MCSLAFWRIKVINFQHKVIVVREFNVPETRFSRQYLITVVLITELKQPMEIKKLIPRQTHRHQMVKNTRNIHVKQF